MDQITQTLHGIVRRLLPDYEGVLTESTSLLSVPHFDSTTLVELIALVEEECDVAFDDSDMDVAALTNLGSLHDMVRLRQMAASIPSEVQIGQ
jgi:acyl carrier protein